MNNERLIVKEEILKNFDFAFKMDWNSEHHHKIRKYLISLTMYFGTTMECRIHDYGSFLAYRFDERHNVKERLDIFRRLFKNEKPSTFLEENCNGCCIFTL